MLWTLILIVPTFLLGAYAQHKVTSTYNKWVKVPSRGRITGREAADAVMRTAGVTGVDIVETRGHLTDHYDPVNKRLVLSSENYRGSSLAALGVAAHEAGHAVQHKVGYHALKFRMSLVPITSISARFLPIVLIGGVFFHMTGLIYLGIFVYLVLTVFQLVTLPVEFDASRRAKQELVAVGILGQDEMVGVNKTLNAAALTYVAAFVASLANLVWLFILSRD